MSMKDSSASVSAAIMPKAWVVNPIVDFGLFMATPLILAFAFKMLIAAAILPTLKLVILGVSSTGHHLPSLMRAYTDKSIFQRFRYRLTLVPPLFIAVGGVCAYYKLSYILFVLFAWSIWHGLMQVLGFARIYDAKSGFSSRVTANFDFLLCLTWFIQIILWSPSRLSGVFSSFYMAGGPLVSASIFRIMTQAWLIFTIIITIGYVAQTLYYGISEKYWNLPKLAYLIASTLFWAYCMDWVGNILVGLIMWEIFHDLQYNVFVWNYNRTRVAKGLSQSKFEKFLFQPNAQTIILYSACIILYGCIGLFSQDVVNIYQHQNIYESIWSRIGNVFAVSALIHFYLDGFIWKVRDQKVLQDLGLEVGKAQESTFIPRRLWLHFAMVAVFLVAGIVMASTQYHWLHSATGRGKPDNLADLVPRSGYTNFMKATRLRSEHKLDSAAIYYEKAIQADTAYRFSEAYLGEIATDKHDWISAIFHYEKAVMADPENVVVQENLGALYLQTGEFEKAQQTYSKLQQHDPSNAEYPYQIGVSLLGQRKGLSAKVYLLRTLELDPLQPKALDNLGLIEQALGNLDSARMMYLKALQIEPEFESAKTHLASMKP